MKEKCSLDRILGEFALSEGASDPGRPVTIWLPSDYKARFDRLQKSSRRKFGKKVRELILAAIELTDAEAS